ncbi:glycerol kinase isoform X2 [Pieris napi]|uniref:glycerol kinase isoform X2 n=2 Tax=Pieris napi TaxID=78633 RepID=UPI001FB94581|nr:glycerol kinase isoform X2 [Pieris napi]
MSEYGKFGPLVGAIDEGTSSARFIIFKANSCEVVATYQKEIEQHFPQEGWVEQDACAILEVVTICINEAVKQLVSLGGSPKDIVAIGVTNQRETTIVWDKITGKPLHNAIVWLDMRTSSTIDKLLDLVPNKTRNKNYLKPLCGLPMSPYFSAVKLRWLADNVEVVQQAIKNGTCCFGTVDTWLIWNLTGGVNGGKHITDVTNASRTMLMNIETLNWDPLLMKFFEIPKSVLPQIKSSSEIYGYIADGPLRSIPISGCLGDQQAALVGQLCLQKGQAKATYGTGCFVLYNTGDVRVNSSKGLLTTVAYQLGANNAPCYALEGSVAVAGAALGWLKDNVGILESAKQSQELAEMATENGSVVFVPAFSGLYAPYWRQDARGVICGITEDTNSNHIVKAALEAVCFQVRDILDAMNEDCGIPLQLLKVDGGMTSNSLVMQMQTDLIGINIIKAGFTESTALGAALVAFWGLDRNTQTPNIDMQNGQMYNPKITDDERDMRYKQWKMAVERSLGWEQNEKPESSNNDLSLFQSSDDVLTSLICTYKTLSIVMISFAFVFASSAASIFFPGIGLMQCTISSRTRKFSAAKTHSV